jgi:hypothetical protein
MMEVSNQLSTISRTREVHVDRDFLKAYWPNADSRVPIADAWSFFRTN